MRSGLKHINTVERNKLALVFENHGLPSGQAMQMAEEIRIKPDNTVNRATAALTPLLTKQHMTGRDAANYFKERKK